MREIRYTGQFKKDSKLVGKRGYEINKLRAVIENWLMKRNWTRGIKTIRFKANLRARVIATFNPIGF